MQDPCACILPPHSTPLHTSRSSRSPACTDTMSRTRAAPAVSPRGMLHMGSWAAVATCRGRVAGAAAARTSLAAAAARQVEPRALGGARTATRPAAGLRTGRGVGMRLLERFVGCRPGLPTFSFIVNGGERGLLQFARPSAALRLCFLAASRADSSHQKNGPQIRALGFGGVGCRVSTRELLLLQPGPAPRSLMLMLLLML